jgi:ribosomal protein L37E
MLDPISTTTATRFTVHGPSWCCGGNTYSDRDRSCLVCGARKPARGRVVELTAKQAARHQRGTP